MRSVMIMQAITAIVVAIHNLLRKTADTIRSAVNRIPREL